MLQSPLVGSFSVVKLEIFGVFYLKKIIIFFWKNGAVATAVCTRFLVPTIPNKQLDNTRVLMGIHLTGIRNIRISISYTALTYVQGCPPLQGVGNVETLFSPKL